MDPSTGQLQEMGNPSKGEERRKARTQPAGEAHKCPRCDSDNTKFCYYNNYSQSQPRYLCKSCKRYWTKGGALRKVPVGGGCRKTKRPSPSPPPSKRTQDPIFPSLSYDHIDTSDGLTLALAALQEHYDHHDASHSHLSVPGNPSSNVAGSVAIANPGLLGDFYDFQGFGHGFGNDIFWDAAGNGGPTLGFNGETMLPYSYEYMVDSTTTSVVAVTENRPALWGLPWQLNADVGNNNNSNNNNNMADADLDCAIEYWHGFFDSPLM